jgi:LAS superfamily LD-carboxypeptidase LdcB
MYSGPLQPVDSALLCPATAASYRTMQLAAAVDGISLHAVSGHRTVAEQAHLYAQLGPGLAAPPGASLHHRATELDISVGAAGSPTHSWLVANAPAHGWVQRYSWEPWHWGNVRGC